MARQQQQQQAPLQLDSAAYGEATGWRRGEHLIDALPYIDPLTPDVKREVEALIEEEMRSSSKRPASRRCRTRLTTTTTPRPSSPARRCPSPSRAW